ncbi:MAG TPA: beta-ketoacyl-ACP synthase III [Gammaproteobacteria bacterium]|nr:beta-ketoacyl-ACP synthase III [Gammaproteobacteria bacterium]
MDSKAVITGTGFYHPPFAITNHELVTSFNQYVDLFNTQNKDAIENGTKTPLEYSSAEFIEKASGIKNRYVIDKHGILDIHRMRPYFAQREDDALCLQAELAVNAISPALQNAYKKNTDIDAIILSTSVLQRAYPNIAIEVQNALSATGFAFDMSVACSSATFGLSMANDLINSDQADLVVVVSPEISSAHLDFTLRDAHFIFGDAATAVIVENKHKVRQKIAWDILSSHRTTEYSNHIRNNFGFINACELKNDESLAIKLFTQKGRKVFRDVVPKAFEHILAHCEKHYLNSHDIKRYWLHQANRHMNDLIAKKLLNRDPTFEDAPLILDQYGNTASAGSIIAFHQYRDDLPIGTHGMICSFGAGYSIGSLLVKKINL